MDFKYHIIEGEFDEQVIQPILSASTIAWDTETTGLHFLEADLVGMSFATEDDSWYFHGEQALSCLRRYVEKIFLDEAKWIIGYNLKFDLHFLRTYYNIEVKAKIADGMIAVWMVDENRFDKSLKAVAVDLLYLDEELPSFKDMITQAYNKARLDYEVKMQAFAKEYPAYDTPLYHFFSATPPQEVSDKKLFTIYDIPMSILGRYAALDARLSFDVMKKLGSILRKQDLFSIFTGFEMPFLRVLYNMEKNGMNLNIDRLTFLNSTYKAEAERLANEWAEKSGGINPNSNLQLSKYLFESLGISQDGLTHNRTKNEDGELESAEYPAVDFMNLCRILVKDKKHQLEHLVPLLEYKKLNKIESTYTDPFLKQSHDGRIYGSFSQIGTVTGRLSSSSPNLQNIPGHGEYGSEIRELFNAMEDYVVLNSDYSQLELRVVAHLSRCPIFYDIFWNNKDPHQMTADLIKVPRQVGKTLNFAWLYGGTHFSLCNTMEKNEYMRAKNIYDLVGKQVRPNKNDAIKWLEDFDEAYPSLVKFKQDTIERAMQVGYIRTIAGRKRHVQELSTYKYLPISEVMRKPEARQLISATIQGSAADVVAKAMVDINKILPNFNAYMTVQVHDEIMIECPRKYAELLAPLVSKLMVDAGKFFNFTVPLVADCKIADNWAEAKG